jgi:hypothetical protein
MTETTTAQIDSKPGKPQRVEPDRKPRDIIPVARLQLRSDLTLNLPSMPPMHGIAADEQIAIEYHSALGMFRIAWTPRKGGSGTPWHRFIPREWCSFEAL